MQRRCVIHSSEKRGKEDKNDRYRFSILVIPDRVAGTEKKRRGNRGIREFLYKEEKTKKRGGIDPRQKRVKSCPRGNSRGESSRSLQLPYGGKEEKSPSLSKAY